MKSLPKLAGPTGSGGLVNRELFEAQFTAQLDRVPRAHPIQVVADNVTVLLFNRRQISGAPDGLVAVAEADRWQATNSRRKGNSRKVELLRDIDVVVEVEAMRVQMVEAEAQLR